ncbi:hypothetical protein MMC28_010395, partial [Mycoblastus sanguinarius]|nr:hypothetical protein [Mycoblastus sanguinarius]
MELGTLRTAASAPFRDEDASDSSSLRSSFDNAYYQSQQCDVHFYDDADVNPKTTPGEPGHGPRSTSWHAKLGTCEELREKLMSRDPHRSRWMWGFLESFRTQEHALI